MKTFKRQRGAHLVEFVLTGLVFFMALFAAYEFARWMYIWNTLTEATRRGARVAAVCPYNHAEIARITVMAANAGDTNGLLPNLTTANVRVDYFNATGAAVTTADYAAIRYVRVSITGYSHRFVVPMLASNKTAPPFYTLLPAESLGYISPDGAGGITRGCPGA